MSQHWLRWFMALYHQPLKNTEYKKCAWGQQDFQLQVVKECFLHDCYNPDSKVHGAYMGPTWGSQDPGGPHVGPMNLAIRESMVYFMLIIVLYIWCWTVRWRKTNKKARFSLLITVQIGMFEIVHDLRSNAIIIGCVIYLLLSVDLQTWLVSPVSGCCQVSRL